MGSILLLLVLGAADVQVTVQVKKPLRVTPSGQLRGAIEVTVSNRGDEGIELEHEDVHGLRFEPKEGPTGLVLHSCDCAFVLGLEQPPEGRRFTLLPGAEKRLTFDDFSCSGGDFTPPKPGAFLLRYHVGPPAAAAAPPDGGFDRQECERRLRAASGPQAFVSTGVPTVISAAEKLRKPRRR